jgi:hypothetical protein
MRHFTEFEIRNCPAHCTKSGIPLPILTSLMSLLLALAELVETKLKPKPWQTVDWYVQWIPFLSRSGLAVSVSIRDGIQRKRGYALFEIRTSLFRNRDGRKMSIDDLATEIANHLSGK